jgi:CTP:molybdopterin cytidylyltransferase MocA
MILAGGRSSRTSMPKFSLAFQGAPLLSRQIERIRASGLKDIIVVTGFFHDEILSLLDSEVAVKRNPFPERGMFSSLQAGLERAAGKGFVLIQPVDCPFPDGETIDILKKESEGRFIVIPLFNAKGGHPVLIPESFFSELLSLQPDFRLDHWLSAQGEVRRVEVNCPSVVMNLNTDEDFAWEGRL